MNWYSICSKVFGFDKIFKLMQEIFIPLSAKFFTIMGMTGFDCKISRIISMSSHEIDLVKRDFTTINGEDNYALAA